MCLACNGKWSCNFKISLQASAIAPVGLHLIQNTQSFSDPKYTESNFSHFATVLSACDRKYTPDTHFSFVYKLQQTLFNRSSPSFFANSQWMRPKYFKICWFLASFFHEIPSRLFYDLPRALLKLFKLLYHQRNASFHIKAPENTRWPPCCIEN